MELLKQDSVNKLVELQSCAANLISTMPCKEIKSKLRKSLKATVGEARNRIDFLSAQVKCCTSVEQANAISEELLGVIPESWEYFARYVDYLEDQYYDKKREYLNKCLKKSN